MLKKILILLVLALFLAGCEPQTLKLDAFEPVPDPQHLKKDQKNGQEYVIYETPEYKLSLALVRYKHVFIMPLEIENKTAHAIETDQYSIGLYDGRDHKPIPMITRKDVESFGARYDKKDPVSLVGVPGVDGALASVWEMVGSPATVAERKGIEKAVEDYYDFRPIFEHDKRSGILCFFHDFKLDYPIVFMARVKSEEIKIIFWPKKEESS